MKNRAVIVDGLRIPFVKSFGAYSHLSNQDMLTFLLEKMAKKYNLAGKKVDEVALGAVINHSTDWNLAREAVLGSGLSPTTPAFNLQRACGTSLETVVNLANKIQLGQIRYGIAGGSDSNSDAPITLSRQASRKFVQISMQKSLKKKLNILKSFRPQDLKPLAPAVKEPRTGLSMGEHCELMAEEWQIAREDQDHLSWVSHQQAATAYEEGFYKDLVLPFEGQTRDNLLRPQTSLEKLSQLKPAFKRSGTLTAGNSTALTDGAACILLASEEFAKENNWPILAVIKDARASAVDYLQGEGLLMAPTLAVSELLGANNLNFSDFDFFEIHEAFAAQVLATLKAWEDPSYCQNQLKLDGSLGKIPRDKINLKGSSLALGHPFAATGSRIVANLSSLLSQKDNSRGLISICTAGGMGVAAILESP